MKFTNPSRSFVLVLIAGLLVLAACQEDTTTQDRTEQEQRFFDLYVSKYYPNIQPRANGLYYFENRAGTGISPDRDDWVLVNHVCYKIPGDIVYESYVEAVVRDNRELDPDTIALTGPYKMQNGTRTAGLTEGLTLMKEGGQATLFFTSELGYGADGSGNIGPYQSLKYEVELLEVIKDIDAYEEARINNYMDSIQQFDTIQDPGSEAIMYYMIDRSSEGKPVVIDSLVSIAYRGYLMDGRVFDERTGENPYVLKAGDVDVIKGWELGLMKLHEGEKARFVIPYQMAYGEEGNKDRNTGLRTIPPYETLLFDIEILSVSEDPNDKNIGK